MANPFKEGDSLNIPTWEPTELQSPGALPTKWERFRDIGAINSKIGPIEGYHTGDTRRAITDYLEQFFSTPPDPHTGEVSYPEWPTALFGGNPNQAAGMGLLDVGVLTIPLDFVDGWQRMTEISENNRQTKRDLTDQLVSEGYDPASQSFYKEFQNRLTEPETDGDAFIDTLGPLTVFGGLGVMAATLGVSEIKPMVKFLRNFGLKHLGAR
jgi:hypothetical protein